MKVIILCLLTSFLGFSQDDIKFQFDYAQFGYNETSNYVEFYYSVDQNTLSVKETDSLNYSEGILSLTIKDSLSGEVVVDNNWLISEPFQNSQEANKSLIGAIGFLLEAGIYTCKMTVKDGVDDNRYKTYDEILQVNPFHGQQVSMGDIQLASNIIQSSNNTSSIFYKNTYEVIPIPNCLFGQNQPVLFYYTELYNISPEPADQNVRIDEQVFNNRGQVVSQNSRYISRKLNSRVEVGRVMTYKLPSGTYTLVLSLVDSAESYGVSSAKKFFVHNPSVKDTFKTQTKSIIAGMFGVMSEEELDDFFAKSEYIASEAEIDTFEKLTTEDGKREFLTKFWKLRDEDPNDEVNYYLRDYIRRIEESNSSFSITGREGWKTDRGRVYLTYGIPSEINRYPNEPETRPYEIWIYYNFEGGVEFVFGNISGFTEYRLLHSTKRGELADPNWQRRIQVR